MNAEYRTYNRRWGVLATVILINFACFTHTTCYFSVTPIAAEYFEALHSGIDLILTRMVVTIWWNVESYWLKFQSKVVYIVWSLCRQHCVCWFDDPHDGDISSSRRKDWAGVQILSGIDRTMHCVHWPPFYHGSHHQGLLILIRHDFQVCIIRTNTKHCLHGHHSNLGQYICFSFITCHRWRWCGEDQIPEHCVCCPFSDRPDFLSPIL